MTTAIKSLCLKVKKEIAKAHDLDGKGSVPPFARDFTSGIVAVYMCSRSMAITANNVEE